MHPSTAVGQSPATLKWLWIAVGALGAISNAVRDALSPVGVTHVDMPFTPARIWAALAEARDASD